MAYRISRSWFRSWWRSRRFPSVFAYQSTLNRAYAEVFDLPESLGVYLGGLTEESFLGSAPRDSAGKSCGGERGC